MAPVPRRVRRFAAGGRASAGRTRHPAARRHRGDVLRARPAHSSISTTGPTTCSSTTWPARTRSSWWTGSSRCGAPAPTTSPVWWAAASCRPQRARRPSRGDRRVLAPGLLAGGVAGYTREEAWHDYRLSAIMAMLNPVLVQLHLQERRRARRRAGRGDDDALFQRPRRMRRGGSDPMTRRREREPRVKRCPPARGGRSRPYEDRSAIRPCRDVKRA